jgi:ATPase subunit of ABC transporter with duplicated ATPase domains
MAQPKIVTFENCDWTKQADIIALFPLYKQLQLASRKPLPKNINIEFFTLKTPYGDQTLLSNTPLILEPNRRQCLYGPNSSGKTLLFHSMVSGEIRDFPKHIHIHHCKELDRPEEMTDTVINTVIKSHKFRNILVASEEKLSELIAANPSDPKVLTASKDNLEFVKLQMNSIGGYQANEKAVKMLRVLGFDEIGQERLVSALSGGLRMRVALCMAFFIEADFLLLDEPTNHLDFPSVLWLENRLRGYKGSFLLVSHDRELLNNVCTSVLLIEDKQIKYYNCGFAEFEKKKIAEDKNKYEEIAKFIKKNQNANPSTMLGRQLLDKKEWSSQYHAKQVAMQCKFTFPAPVALETKETKIVDGVEVPLPQEEISLINLENVRFSYDVKTGHYIFNDPISFNVLASTRVGVMGPNGAGKSTFLKLLTHKLTPVSGTVTDHPNFKLAYFGQHSTAELNLETTPMEFMTSQFPTHNSGALRAHLGKTGIVGTAADTRMQGLSFSQRSCIVFAKLTFECPHLLIMDEPTNFLDLESVDSLISACNKYRGALLLVSHNRDFLKKCAKQYLSIVPGKFQLFNTLKTAEQATYTFIGEMESGGKVSTKDVIQNNPGGGSVHSSQKVGDAAQSDSSATTTPADSKPATPAAKSNAVVVLAAAPAADSKPTPAAPVAAAKKDESKEDPSTPAKDLAYAVGEKVQALWTDKKWYNAVVKSYNPGNQKFTVTYIEYGNSTALPVDQIRKFIEKPKQGGNNNNRQAHRNRQ